MQRSISSFFVSKGNTDEDKNSDSGDVPGTSSCETDLLSVELYQSSNTTSTISTLELDMISVEAVDNIHEDNQLPDCWTEEQFLSFKEKYQWLVVKTKKLGCSICKEVSKLKFSNTQGVQISPE